MISQVSIYRIHQKKTAFLLCRITESPQTLATSWTTGLGMFAGKLCDQDGQQRAGSPKYFLCAPVDVVNIPDMDFYVLINVCTYVVYISYRMKLILYDIVGYCTIWNWYCMTLSDIIWNYTISFDTIKLKICYCTILFDNIIQCYSISDYVVLCCILCLFLFYYVLCVLD